MSKLFTEWVRHPDDENSWIPMRDVEEIPTVDDSKSYKIKYYGPNLQLLNVGNNTQPIYFYDGEPVPVDFNSEDLSNIIVINSNSIAPTATSAKIWIQLDPETSSATEEEGENNG